MDKDNLAQRLRIEFKKKYDYWNENDKRLLREAKSVYIGILRVFKETIEINEATRDNVFIVIDNLDGVIHIVCDGLPSIYSNETISAGALDILVELFNKEEGYVAEVEKAVYEATDKTEEFIAWRLYVLMQI